MDRQRTLAAPVTFEGIGVHSGEPCRVEVEPAPADTGIVLTVVCPTQVVHIPLTADHVVGTERCTAVGRGEARIDTVEHLAAALYYGCGVDNAAVSVKGSEIPILDGSAEPFARKVEQVGVVELDAPRRMIRLERPLFVSRDDSVAVAVPADELRLTVAIDFRAPVGQAIVDLVLTEESFKRELAPARTFGFIEDYEQARAAGLSAGASEECVLVVWEREYGSALRLPDEPARHKMVDLVGDLALVGKRVLGHIVVVRGGHALHHALASALIAVGREGGR